MRERTLTVSQLNDYIKGVFEDELVLHNLCVEGEIFEYKQSASATFVTLREHDSLLRCICFDRLQPVKIGDKVLLTGSVSFHDRSGKISFIYHAVRKIGTGNLLAEFAALRDKLQAEGVFDSKKEIVAPIKKIAVITGETGIVIHDFIQTVHRKRTFTDIHLYTCLVQGKTAATEIIETLRLVDGQKYDMIVIARGGGSSDDLSVFNDESLARAVAGCATPVLSAVGHETDFTLCDFAADVRAGTPSIAGEIISRKNEEFFLRLQQYSDLLQYRIERAVQQKATALYRSAAAISHKSELKLERIDGKLRNLSHVVLSSVLSRYNDGCNTVIEMRKKMDRAVENTLQEHNMRMESAIGRLNANNPLRILSMGYAKLYASDGSAVTCGNTHVGDMVRAVTQDGQLSATVTEVYKGDKHGI